MEQEKLYSPNNFYLRDTEAALEGQYDEVQYWRDELAHEDAFGYIDQIEAHLSRDRKDYDNGRGLAEYLREGPLSDKVQSLVPNVELHGDKLWCVADVRLNESLTPLEMADLKSWWGGQLSDGWGEGLEQREIMVNQGELYLEPWTASTDFFIATQAEFDRRMGVEHIEPETPAGAALHEPDAFDNKETAALREQLTDRLDDNLSDYFTTLRGVYNEEIVGMSSEIGARMDAHYYLTEIHNFHTSELQYLLQFENPLAVVADEFAIADVDRSGTMWGIFDRQEALQGDYTRASGDLAAKKNASASSQESRNELLEGIAKRHCRVETLETRKSDSLDFHDISVWGLKAALEAAFDAGSQRQNTQTRDAGQEPAQGKQSLLAGLREAQAKTEPPKDKNHTHKSGPEL